MDEIIRLNVKGISAYSGFYCVMKTCVTIREIERNMLKECYKGKYLSKLPFCYTQSSQEAKTG
jgi:hypothetical protein